MKKLFFLLLAAGALFWLLGRQPHTLTLAPVSLSAALAPGSSTPFITNTRQDILEIRIPDADMDYYDVNGGSTGEIREALNRGHAHGSFDGYTGWNVRWAWPGFGKSDCDLSAASLDTSVRVRLPRWQPPREADAALVLKWNSYLGNLARHEQGHVQLAQHGFAKMQQILQASTCDEADAKLNVVLSEMRQADLRYDAETHHGTTQGAKFP
ncbi:MAG: DUF922 domain-containing protein [Moraxellaceae bacterium]